MLGLTAHPAYDGKTPNRLRALVGGFSEGNPARFHDPSGGGYRFLADQILAVDALQPDDRGAPDRSADLVGALPAELADSMQQELRRIAASRGIVQERL